MLNDHRLWQRGLKLIRVTLGPKEIVLGLDVGAEMLGKDVGGFDGVERMLFRIALVTVDFDIVRTIATTTRQPLLVER